MPSQATCTISGETFETSDREAQMRADFGLEGSPTTAPWTRIRHMGAFWPHFHLHERQCDATGNKIISVYRPDCPYPVWHKDHWMDNANPPSAEFQPGQPVFEQLKQLFSQCPIPHNIGVGNDNCDYTDDWWYSRNCFLSHSGFEDEDLSYCYRARKSSDCQFLAFVTDCQLCVDVINSLNCFQVIYALNSRDCSDSAFLYDCRNCRNCLFCFNLRNKEYCVGNQQMTKEQYEAARAQWNLSSRSVYEQAKANFGRMLHEVAWHRALMIDKTEESTGNYLENAKGCRNCFFINGSEDCINCVRSVSGHDKNSLDCVGCFGGEVLLGCSNAQDQCYNSHFIFNLTQCKDLEYCSNCYLCKNCFGCCGLKGKEYHIFNTPVPQEQYEGRRDEIIAAMKQTGEYGQFFPASFSPVPYSESWSAVHFDLDDASQSQLGFRVASSEGRDQPAGSLPLDQIPDTAAAAPADLPTKVFWDPVACKPLRITQADIDFCARVGVPLPNSFYASRLIENFRMLHYSGKNRFTTCARSGADVETNWPPGFDGRILSEEEYVKEIA